MTNAKLNSITKISTISGTESALHRLLYEDVSHILNPVPMNVTLRCQLPSNGDRGYWLLDMTLSDDIKRNDLPLLGQIPESSIFRYISKQVELDNFLKILQRKVIHDYSPISIVELRPKYPNSPLLQDIFIYY